MQRKTQETLSLQLASQQLSGCGGKPRGRGRDDRKGSESEVPPSNELTLYKQQAVSSCEQGRRTPSANAKAEPAPLFPCTLLFTAHLLPPSLSSLCPQFKFWNSRNTNCHFIFCQPRKDQHSREAQIIQAPWLWWRLYLLLLPVYVISQIMILWAEYYFFLPPEL